MHTVCSIYLQQHLERLHIEFIFVIAQVSLLRVNSPEQQRGDNKGEGWMEQARGKCQR